ncbi:MAG: hypothetical protein WDN30_03845 [Pararobbsia sp.]
MFVLHRSRHDTGVSIARSHCAIVRLVHPGIVVRQVVPGPRMLDMSGLPVRRDAGRADRVDQPVRSR